MMKPEPVTVFLSYAREDELLLQKLVVHLSGLKRQGLITTWYDRQIATGTAWAQAIDTHLEQASVILLLVSPDFLASDYCYEIEVQRALQQHQADEARVIPLVLRPCDWSHTSFALLQGLPRESKSVTQWSNQDAAWTDVVVRQKGEPWYLITNQPVETEKQAWDMVFISMKRWTMETSFRYEKSELAMETARLWKGEEREKLLLMVTLVYAFLLSLLDVTLQPLKDWLLRQYCHRTGKRLRETKVPLSRMRWALSRLWLAIPPVFSSAHPGLTN